jgi:uncharacterized protein (TIGR04222 family)
MRHGLWLLLVVAFTAGAEERILSFHSDVLVRTDGWIEVVESIRVVAEGREIRRGIYRDFPTRYVDRRGLDYVVDFRPRSVLRNDATEDFHSVELDNGVRTYFGSRDRFLAHGEHEYVFRYEANRLLGFFEDIDELYWNVTGHGWAFPIERASTRIRFEFPVDADSLELAAYTGRRFDTGADVEYRREADGSVLFETTRALPPAHGLTVAVGWPKGLVAEPDQFDRLGWALRDNRNLLIVLAGFLALLAYYVPVWRHFGRDPEAGVVVTRYEPPEGYSPASLRYVRQMYYDDKTMTAAVVNLAVKGYLRIVDSDGVYRLERTEPRTEATYLAAGERELHAALFDDASQLTLDNFNHGRLGRARTAHRASLVADYNKKYFSRNGLLNAPAAAIVIATSVVALSMGDKPPGVMLLAIIVNFMVLAFFSWIMKRPTLRGRKLLDEMEGFEDYLEVAEKEEINLRNPPDKTPELFEALLPYALALGVEQKWSEKFAAVLAAANIDGSPGWHPAWYSGHFDATQLTSATTSMSRGLGEAISSSVTPPGSSSGSGGGGFLWRWWRRRWLVDSCSRPERATGDAVQVPRS